MSPETSIASALLDLKRAAVIQDDTPWALVGGEALIAYGIPKNTQDADAMIEANALELVAEELVTTFGWTPLDDVEGEYVESDQVQVLFMQDPVLYDIGEDRRMIALRTPMGHLVELLAAQHPVEKEMVAQALPMEHHGVMRIPVAPLGGILLVKTKADRPKDIAAIEQTAEHAKREVLKVAVAWAKKRDPATTEDLQSILSAVRIRRTPKTRKSYPTRRRR